MGLKIVFGWHLDGPSFPETCDHRISSLGSIILGPVGLIRQLALRFGISKPLVAQAVRIARYMKALETIDDGSQFFSNSFAIDPWSTASCLLIMRDQLVAAGWDGATGADAHAKLHSFAKVETLINPLGSLSETQREVLVRLRSKTMIHKIVDSIDVVTPLELLPGIWRQIFASLALSGITINELNVRANINGSTDLNKIQRFLLSGELEMLRGDGSFCVLQADDEFQLSSAVSSWLDCRRGSLSGLVALRNTPTTLLDSACARVGLPRFGGHENSRWRSALQVLPLMLQTCWRPANPYRTVELISLANSPLPRTLTHHFIQALRVEPGFGGKRWRDAWRAVETQLKSEFKNGENSEDVDEKIAHAIKDLRFWLEPTRWDPVDGMPIEQALQICRRVRKWAASNFRKDGHNEMYGKVISSCYELEEALVATGFQKINNVQLNRVLDAVSGEGCGPEKWRAQAADWTNIDHPGQIWGKASYLLWWGFTASAVRSDRADPWTDMDLSALAEARIQIDRPAQIAVREAWSWRQAIFNVDNELLVCAPQVIHGENTFPHPLWNEIEPIVEYSNGVVVKQVHELLAQPRPMISTQIVSLTRRHAQSLPTANRVWTAPPGKILQRHEESVSSINQLLGCSMAWVLRYHAQMHPTILLTLPDGDQLIGDIAHTMFKRLFEESLESDTVFAQMAELIFDEIVESVGLPLLLRGKNFQRLHAKRLLIQAARNFYRTVKDLDLEVIACEMRKNVPFGEDRFVGDIDILLRNAEGIPIIFDYKWSKSIKYRIEEIQESKHVQLAAYAWMHYLESGDIPLAGYYMLRQRRILQCGSENLGVGQYFPSPQLMVLWQGIEEAYFSLLSQLSEGIICATGVGQGSEEADSNLFSLEPPCKICSYGNICGVSSFGNE